MKQEFSYAVDDLRKFVQYRQGILNVDISDNEKLQNNLQNVLIFLDLEDIFEIINTEIVKGANNIRFQTSDRAKFTLKTKDNVDKDIFFNSIKKFQDYFRIDHNEIVSNFINEIISFVKTIPSEFEIVFGLTNWNEGTMKARKNMPQYWFYRDRFILDEGHNNLNEEVYKYFIQQGYKSDHDYAGGYYLFIFGRTVNKELPDLKRKR